MESTLEKYAIALYRLAQGMDPVVLIWTSTLALALTYFLVTKLLEPFLPTSSSSSAANRAAEGDRNSGGERGGGRSEGNRSGGGGRSSGTHQGKGHSKEFWDRVRPEVRRYHETFKRKVSPESGVGSLLTGRRVTISTCGVLFEEKECHQLKSSATLVPLAKDLVESISYFGEVFLITQVFDDASEENVRKTLQASGIVGSGGLVKGHHALFCEKHVSKISIARQIEPGIHIDAEKATVLELQRFLPKVLFIANAQGDSAAPSGSSQKPNMLVDETLKTFCTS
ncbi:hypothetical protein HOP50_19g84020 [Chloropicon primus]|uniref:Uncharacterized protein n=1 Tax=Chloropicon primus TaxID=1764295 RepID=A0A5B8N1X5_9CHLO|nr:hypothetical protein A3770_19p83780 [Chloropicon primus]UPR05055.1 hypothetical protein HOP50_19g84020 [Chloropicon primus]|mmetsp:Transcript_4057/g.11784  ORF Transcript_4057/g.11784 Transcript_4057/m.11784 type:complete len:283 (+) Transcript_4057:366-1214(+)|eukprot:QDZ25860.1 hypothetical protein A3770_19p83780 [Chloropicon primus]